MVGAVLKGGGRVEMDPMYRTQITARMMDAFRKGNVLGGLLRAPFAAVEQLSRPILEHLVPRQKLGVFMDLAKDAMDRNPNMTDTQLQDTMGKIWNSVDNRLGQMVYDNVFWNKITKDLAMGSVRSVGWNLGTFRELGGGVYDLAKQPVNLLRGKNVELTHRAAYTLALPTLLGIMGAITQYLYTGKPPESLKDLYYPQTGKKDENGDPERIAYPSYMKDVYAYGKHPLTTVSHKLAPVASLLAEMLSNQNYYGVKIRNSTDPIVKQVMDIAEHIGQSAEPFSLRNYNQLAKRGEGLGKTLLPVVGITPAPASINQTKAEELAKQFIQEKMGNIPRTKEEAQKSDLKREIVTDLRLQKPASDDIKQAYQQGIITQKDVTAAKEVAKNTPIVNTVKHLGLEESLQVFDKATPEEKQLLKPLIKEKWDRFKENHSEQEIQRIKQWRNK
jgi:hypothetical protein